VAEDGKHGPPSKGSWLSATRVARRTDPWPAVAPALLGSATLAHPGQRGTARCPKRVGDPNGGPDSALGPWVVLRRSAALRRPPAARSPFASSARSRTALALCCLFAVFSLDAALQQGVPSGRLFPREPGTAPPPRGTRPPWSTRSWPSSPPPSSCSRPPPYCAGGFPRRSPFPDCFRSSSARSAPSAALVGPGAAATRRCAARGLGGSKPSSGCVPAIA